MEAIYKLKANEISPKLMETIKKLFQGKEITITVSTISDETSYLIQNPENEKYLMESIGQEPIVRFTPTEFQKKIKEL